MEHTKQQMYNSIVERLVGREDAHVETWTDLGVQLLPTEEDLTWLWRLSVEPTRYKLFEVCIWWKGVRTSCIGSSRDANAWCSFFLVDCMREAEA